MPHSGDNIVISGAADSEIRVHEVSRKETFQVLRYHSSRVKRIATSRDQPHIFWSASEDGTVMSVAKFIDVVMPCRLMFFVDIPCCKLQILKVMPARYLSSGARLD